MRKLFFCLTAAAVVMTASPVAAHPEDEGGPFSRGPTTAELAQMAVDRLVSEKKLPDSWGTAKLVSFDFRTKNGSDQYVLVYENPAVKQASKRKLYVIMTSSGQFVSANHKLI